MNKHRLAGWGGAVLMALALNGVSKCAAPAGPRDMRETAKVVAPAQSQKQQVPQSPAEVPSTPLPQHCAASPDIVSLLERTATESSYSAQQRALLRPAYQAVMEHESHCNTLATSKTGAAGYYQLTVNTADGSGVRPLFAPSTYFARTPGGLDFRNHSERFRVQYGNALKQRMQAATAKHDVAAAKAIDGRYDPSTNVSVEFKEFTNHFGRVRHYVANEDQALHITLIEHNLGVTRVENQYLRHGARTARAVLAAMDHDKSVEASKKREVHQFYNDVTHLMAEYSGAPQQLPHTPPPVPHAPQPIPSHAPPKPHTPAAPKHAPAHSLYTDMHRLLRGHEAYGYIPKHGDTRYAIAGGFHRTHPQYHVGPNDVVDCYTGKPATIHTGQRVCLIAHK